MRIGQGRGLSLFLGDLEAEIMETLWSLAPQTAKAVQHTIAARKKLAITTILTILSRLTAKGLVERAKSEKAYVYAPTLSRQEFLEREIGAVVTTLRADFREYFDRAVAEAGRG